jgi:hypothetical protein
MLSESIDIKGGGVLVKYKGFCKFGTYQKVYDIRYYFAPNEKFFVVPNGREVHFQGYLFPKETYKDKDGLERTIESYILVDYFSDTSPEEVLAENPEDDLPF